MDLDVVLLSRIQFAFLVTFHIIFPAFTIGLAAWLATIEGMSLVSGNPIYRRLFDFWLKVFAVSFGMGSSPVAATGRRVVGRYCLFFRWT